MPGNPDRGSYRYAKVEQGLYVCLHQNLAMLPWLLSFKGKALGLSPTSFTESVRRVRRFLAWGKRLVRYTVPFRNEPLNLALPCFGHLCLEVHRGYKVFDLQRDTVTKLFKPEVDSATVLLEIERARAVSPYDFAPRVRRWDGAERWYEEEYINGTPVTTYTHGYPVTASDPTNFVETYYQYLAPCIERLILAQTPQRLCIGEYVDKLRKTISGMFSKDRSGINIAVCMNDFIDIIAKKLHGYKDCEIHIVLSHGDFGNNHVMITNHGIKIIDWEYMSHRSLLYDLYSCLLEQLFFDRKVPDVTDQVKKAISLLQENLSSQLPIVASDLIKLSEAYRWIFYIEQICSGLEYPDTSIKAKIKWMDAFHKFETMQS
jgi:hypothetical protein